jgi:hypothetical protein
MEARHNDEVRKVEEETKKLMNKKEDDLSLTLRRIWSFFLQLERCKRN